MLRTMLRHTLEQTELFSAIVDVPGNPVRLEARTRSGQTVTIDLTNLIADAKNAAPQEQQRRVVQFAKATIDSAKLAAAGTQSAPTAAMVVPTIKSKAWVDSAPADVATEPLVADLHIAYAFDRKDSLTYARWPALEAMGLQRPALRQTAAQNLRTRLPRDLKTQGDGKSLMLIAGGNYEASLLLLDELWTQLSAALAGDLIACALARDVCLVTTSSSVDLAEHSSSGRSSSRCVHHRSRRPV